jgi:membrane-bound lytic murein transglycosylase F
VTALLALLAAVALLFGGIALWREEPSALARVLERGELVVLTRNSASTYYRSADGEAGLEYDLARGFADSLGVDLRVELRTGINVLKRALDRGAGDLVAAGMSITPERQRDYRFGPVYQVSEPVVIYRAGRPRPQRPRDLVGRRLVVNAGASHVQALQRERARLPALAWEEIEAAGVEHLLQMVTVGEADLAVVDSTDLHFNRAFYPEINVGFALDQKEPMAWMFRRGRDDSLVQKAREYFHRIELEGTLAGLIDRYREQEIELRPVATITFQEQVRDRLPEYRLLFEAAADQFGFDWRLLAALGYQESHWDADAVSPTGVRGIMMLTRSTADYLNVQNRRDPAQSILGGARYLRELIDSLPARIPEPDRTWLGLAAYNIGLGHLEDARVLTQRLGGDPDRWQDVRDSLPLLNQARYHETLRYGYARGHTAARYVENVRAYHELLSAMDERNHPLVAQDWAAPEAAEGGWPAVTTPP